MIDSGQSCMGTTLKLFALIWCLHIEVMPVPFEELNKRAPGEPSDSIRKRVRAARAVQSERFARRRNEED
jgi:predicted ATPase with chaperone activity